MATIKTAYTTNQSITITLTSVTNGSFATSSAIDNSTNLFIGADIQVTVKTNSASTSSTGSVSVFLLRTGDAGTTYDDANSTNATLLGTFATTANSTTYVFSIDTMPFGILGDHWKISVLNNSGNTLDASIGSAKFTGKQFSVV